MWHDEPPLLVTLRQLRCGPVVPSICKIWSWSVGKEDEGDCQLFQGSKKEASLLRWIANETISSLCVFASFLTVDWPEVNLLKTFMLTLLIEKPVRWCWCTENSEIPVWSAVCLFFPSERSRPIVTCSCVADLGAWIAQEHSWQTADHWVHWLHQTFPVGSSIYINFLDSRSG